MSESQIYTGLHSENGYNVDGLDVVLAKNAAELLNKHYPNHIWAVHVNSTKTGGIMVIKNLLVSATHGYVLHLTNVNNDPTLKSVIKAGGEILERAGLVRGANQWVRPQFVEGVQARFQPRRFVNG